MAKAAKKASRPSRQVLLAEAIAACRDASGSITPKAVVAAARDPKSVLHSEFEWDADRAAEQTWLRTAAALIREVKFTVTFEDKKLVVPYYVSDPRSDESSYISTIKVARSQSLARAVLRDEMTRIKQAIHRAMGMACAVNLKKDFELMLEEVVAIETQITDDE
jgi:hypothetical protein